MQKTFKVSLICATYNRFDLLCIMLESLTKQSFDNWECVVVDDNSSDLTYSKLIESELDDRIKIYKRGLNFNKGLSGCRNYGLTKASGQYIMFVDDDDLLPTNHMEISVKAIEKTQVDFVHFQKLPFTEVNEVTENNNYNASVNYIRIIDEKCLIEHLWGNLGLASCTMIIKRSCFNYLQFHEDLRYAEEWNLYGKFLLEGFKGYEINNILYFNRKSPNSNTGKFHSGDSAMMDSYKVAHLDLLEYMIKNKSRMSFLFQLRCAKYFYVKAIKNGWIELIQLIQRKLKVDYFILKLTNAK
jgi:GalNAc5-diNAcBac-PP-undecaprenol beta-1,3-glucosyltransferase